MLSRMAGPRAPHRPSTAFASLPTCVEMSLMHFSWCAERLSCVCMNSTSMCSSWGRGGGSRWVEGKESSIVAGCRGIRHDSRVGRDDAARGREATERDRRPIARNVSDAEGAPVSSLPPCPRRTRSSARGRFGRERRNAWGVFHTRPIDLDCRARDSRADESRRPALQLLVPARDALHGRARPSSVPPPVGRAVSRTLPLASRALRVPREAAGSRSAPPRRRGRAGLRGGRPGGRLARGAPDRWRRRGDAPPRPGALASAAATTAGFLLDARPRAPSARASPSVVPDASPASSTAAAPPAAVPDYTLRGPYRVRRLPKLEHTCVSCFPRCVGDACLLSIDAYVPSAPPPLPDAMFPRVTVPNEREASASPADAFSRGPYPFAVITSSFLVDAEQYASYARRLCSWGYVVLQYNKRENVAGGNALDDVVSAAMVRELIGKRSDVLLGPLLMRDDDDDDRPDEAARGGARARGRRRVSDRALARGRSRCWRGWRTSACAARASWTRWITPRTRRSGTGSPPPSRRCARRPRMRGRRCASWGEIRRRLRASREQLRDVPGRVEAGGHVGRGGSGGALPVPRLGGVVAARGVPRGLRRRRAGQGEVAQALMVAHAETAFRGVPGDAR